MMRRLFCGLVIVAVVGVAGCATEPRYVTTPLSRPERPVLPRVYQSELMCVPDEAYRRQVERERLMREYAEKLEAIIDATRAEGQ